MAINWNLSKYYFTSDFTEKATYNSSGDRDVIKVDPSKKERAYGELGGYDPAAEMSILVKCADMPSPPVEGDVYTISETNWRAISVKKDTKGICYKIGLVSEFGRR